MEKIIWTKDRIMRLICFCVCETFCLGSALYMAIAARGGSQIGICLVSGLCLTLPTVLERLLKIRVATPVYIFVLLYAIGPTLGHAYTFYYLIPWWDTLLHTVGGVVFALLGAYLPRLFYKNEEDCPILLCVLFGLFFSITIAVLWEFFEFFCDRLFSTDLQSDTLLREFYSYILGDKSTGNVGFSGAINEITLGGVTVDGYIDLGLFDTVKDMFVESLGAALYVIVFALDKGKHCSLSRVKKISKKVE